MRITAWQEMPSSGRRYLGLRLWLSGGEVLLGRRMWRWRLEAGRELCLLFRRHDPVTVIDKAELAEMVEGPYGLTVKGRITKQHRECARCKKQLEETT